MLDRVTFRKSLTAFVKTILFSLFAINVIGCTSSSTEEQLSVKPPVETPETQSITFSQITSNQIMIKGGEYTSVSWPFLTGQAAILSLYGSADGGTTWTLLEPYVANSGVFVFHAPIVDSSDYVLKAMDGNYVVAISEPIHIISTAPRLKSDKFAQLTEISKTEFSSYMTSTYNPPANPSLSGKTWTIDFTNLVDAPIGFIVKAVVGSSQFGGPVSCANQVCTFQAPSDQMPQDELQFRFEDPVGNQSSIIKAYVDLGFGSSSSSSNIGLDANIVNATKDDVAAKIPNLLPGDVLVLAPGVYEPLNFVGVNGTADDPIIVVSQDRNNPAEIMDSSAPYSNLISIGNTSFVSFRFLRFSGISNGTSDGIKATHSEGKIDHISVENCLFQDFSTGQIPVNLRSLGWNVSIRSNRFVTSKKGVVLGDSDIPVVNSIVEGNYFEGFSLDAVKGTFYSVHPGITGFPTGNLKNVIRNNVFNKNGNTNSYPMVHLEKVPSTDLYEIYGNFFFNQAGVEAFLQASSRLSVHHNLFAKGSSAIGISLVGLDYSLGHVFQNTFLDLDTAIKVNTANSSANSVIKGNLFFTTQTISASGGTVIISPNKSDTLANATNYLKNVTTSGWPWTDFDLYPISNLVEGSDIGLSTFSTTSVIDYDFNGYKNSSNYYGAYSSFGVQNPGWKPIAESRTGGMYPSFNSSLPASPLIPEADVRLSLANPESECPTTPPGSNTLRICNSDDNSAACDSNNANVIKPNEISLAESVKLTTWKSRLNTALANKLTSGMTLEIMYSTTATNTKAPNGTKAAYGRNFFAGCDIQIPAAADDITIKGVCSAGSNKRPTFFYDSSCPNETGRRAIFHNSADGVKFLNLNFIFAKASTANDTAAILDSGKNTTIGYSVFYKNNYGYVSYGDNLIHDTSRKSTVYIKNSLFEKNGDSSNTNSSGISIGKGVTHALIEDSLMLRQLSKGNEVSSSAQQTTIRCSVLSGRSPKARVADEQKLWQDDALAMFPVGGKVNLNYNAIYKGSGTLNGYQLINFNAENKDQTKLNFYQDFNLEKNHIYNLMNSATPAFLLNYNQRDSGPYSLKTQIRMNDNLIFGLGTVYRKARFFNLQSGYDLSFDLSSSTMNKLLTSPIIPNFTDSLTGAQFVTFPGWDKAAHDAEGTSPGDGLISATSNCPDFNWIIRGLPN